MRIEIIGPPGSDRNTLLTMVNYMLRDARLRQKTPDFPPHLFPGMDRLRERLVEEQTHIDVIVRDEDAPTGNPPEEATEEVQRPQNAPACHQGAA